MLLPEMPMLPAYRHAKRVGRRAGVAFLLVGGFKLEVQRLGYCAVLLVASARVNARAKV